MEAAGLAVNLLPLMISVAENYKRLFLTPLARYQDFSNEAGRYIVRLENQRAIFQTQCILLLSTVISMPAASQIVGAVHELAPAAKVEVEERLESVLGDSRTALIGTIRAIDAALLATQRECKELSETVEKEDQGKKKIKFGDLNMFSNWKSHIREKLKFSFSESHLSANVKTLTDLNQDFVTLSSLSQMPSKADKKNPTHCRTKTIIDKHRLIGMAAEEVWQFLDRLESGGCEEHWAHLGVGEQRVNQDETTSGSTKFNLALCCTRTSLELSRFVVTTKLLEQDSPNHVGSLAEVKGALRSILKIEEGPAGMLEQGMADHVTTQASNSAPRDGPSSGRKHSRQDGQGNSTGICAFLNHPEFDRVSGSIQAFSACDESAKSSNPKAACEGPRGVLRSTTLHELLQTCSRDRPGNGLSFPERLRLAKILSVAYFSFHSTGWANSGCNSKGVCFQWTNQDDVTFDIKGLHMPYLQSRVYSSQSPAPFGLCTASLLDLGVLLLEIGYSMNWDTLENVCPTQYNNNDLLSAVLKARIILENGLWDMGRAYRNIVSKLVECAFGKMYDLDDPKDETAFLEAVIQPLEEEERKLEAFLGPDRP